MTDDDVAVLTVGEFRVYPTEGEKFVIASDGWGWIPGVYDSTTDALKAGESFMANSNSSKLWDLSDLELVDLLRGTCGSHDACREQTAPVREEMVRRFILRTRVRNAPLPGGRL